MEYVVKSTNGQIYHHGILGQKWGVRRYQNLDGSLTSAGKKKYAIKGFTEDAYNSNKTKAGKIYDKLTDAHNPNSSNNHADYNKAHDKSKKISSMSNAELKEINKRLNMEQEYKRLSSNDIKTGKDYMNSVIKAGTTVATVTSTALTIYNNYDKIKKIISDINKSN